MGLGPIYYGDPVNRAHPQNRGLFAWWPTLPWYSSGPRLIDVAGRAHGVLTNGALWAPGPSTGNAVLCDGSNDHVTATLPTVPSAAVTVSMWLYATSAFVGSRDNDGVFSTVANYAFYATVGGGVPNLYTGSWLEGSGAPMVAGRWYQVAFAHGASAGRYLWVNGRSVGSDGGGLTAWSTGAVNIGRRADAASAFAGRIADVKVWGRLLTDGEIFAHYVQSARGSPDALNRLPRMAVVGIAAAPPATNRRRRVLMGAA